MMKRKKLSLILLGTILALGVGAGIGASKIEIGKAEDETFIPTTTYVEEPSATLVEDASTLTENDKIVIAATNYGMAMGPISSTKKFMTGVGVTIVNSKITTLNNAVIFTLGGSSGAWTFSSDSQYLYYKDSGNDLYIGDSTETTNTWTIAIVDGKATIANTGKTSRLIQCNPGSSKFACYTSAQEKPGIYKMNSPVSGYNYDYLLDVLKGDYCEFDKEGLDLINTRYETMTVLEQSNFNSAEIVGVDGNTYTGEQAYTAAMVRRTSMVANPTSPLVNVFQQNEIVMIIMIVSLIGLSAIAGTLYIIKRKKSNR